MVKEGCPSRTSLGITRSFPRLYPTMGLVTFALLTLTPLALRPVRLACLIHAANVHSEPGSNPSKVSFRTLMTKAFHVSPRKVEEFPLTGRTEPSVFSDARCRFRETAHAAKTENQAVPQRQRLVAGSPQGITFKHDPRSTKLSKKIARRHFWPVRPDPLKG